MNWNTHSVVKGQNSSQLQKLLDEDGGCEHVEVDVNMAYAIRRERDSFGTVGSYLVCEACDDKADEEEGQEEHVCVDCKQTHLAKDGIAWRWYDFYEAQGDVPTRICNACKVLPKHKLRVANDQAEHDREFGQPDDDIYAGGACERIAVTTVNVPDAIPSTTEKDVYVQQPNPHDTSVEKSVHQKALARMTAYWFMVRRSQVDDVKWLIELLRDGVIELTLRTEGPGGRFLTLEDCPVLAIRPEDKELAERISHYLPFFGEKIGKVTVRKWPFPK